MKKSLVFLIVAAALGVLLANERPHPETNNKMSQSINNDSSQTNTASTDNNQTTTTNDIMKDGTFLGSVEKNEYETVQVEIKVSSTKITEINVPILDYTVGGRSVRVVENSLPLLKKDAITKQSSKIDYVSGATLISKSFADSLETAIINAKK